jgi:hypothetical protein
MLIPDNVYRRIPQYWLLIGVMFLVFGLFVGTTYKLFPAYMGLGALCITRSLWIYQARWRYHKRNELHMTQAIRVTRKPAHKK